MNRSQFDSVISSVAPEAAAAPSVSFARSSLDSLGVVTLLVAVEDAFGIEFDEQSLAAGADMTPDTLFDTASALAAA